MDKKKCVASNPLQVNKALELQALIMCYFPKYTNCEVEFEEYNWDFGGSDNVIQSKIRSMAISKGYCKKDFIVRNRMVVKKEKAISPIKTLHRALVATYVTSGNYYNTPLRRRLNPVQRLVSEPFTMSMEDVIEKFRRESEEAARGYGFSLDFTVRSMRLQGRLSAGFSTLLLKNLLLERKRKGTTFRGVLASSQFVTLLDYYSQHSTVVTTDQFLSTTTYQLVAREFSAGKYDSRSVSEGDKKVVFIVEGYSGAEISAWIDEGEVLYPPEVYFQVCPVNTYEKIRYLGATYGAFIYKLKEVPAPDTDKEIPFLTDVHKLQR